VRVGGSRSLNGVIAAIPTPVTSAGEPDHQRFVALARSLLKGGCDGLNVLGTTGEAMSFSVAQRMALMSFAAESLDLSRLMVGTGAAAMADAVRLTRHAAELGFAGALILPPFYYKNVADDGVISYITSVAITTAESQIPLYLYNFPALSGVAYSPGLVTRLIALFGKRIAGLKDSSGNLEYARKIAAISPQLGVFPSSEAVLLDARAGAFAGCISATANINSAECAKAFHAGDEAALLKAVAIRRIFDGVPLVPGVKYMLSCNADDAELARLVAPLVPLSDEQKALLRTRWAAIA
jgi:4-hydroxy-tetrahydrodipicolinate synthase